MTDSPQQPMVMAHRHMVVAGHYLATEAGLAILEAGGNAVDAGVAAGITLGVVHSDQVQFSGVAPMLIFMADTGAVTSLAGLGRWPAATRPEVFDAGHIPLGLLRTVVPAAPDAWITALRHFGTMTFGEVAARAVALAREGFTVHPTMHDFITRNLEQYRLWPENARIWLKNGQPPELGDLLVQEDLGSSIQYMIDEEAAARGRGREAGLTAARNAFYSGDIARRILAYHAENGGWLSAADLAGHRTPIESPLMIRFRGIDVYSCRPWCQGPTLLQMLRILNGFDLGGLGHNSADYVHIVAETMKLVFADRERFYGDPECVDVPIDELLSESHAERRRELIDPDKAWPGMPPPGDIPGYGGASWPLDPDSSPSEAAADTSYVCTMDRWGNVCSFTPSDVSFESPVIPGLGFCPSPRGSQSFALAGHASSVAPGKRPRLTPNPALARVPGKSIMPFGAPGGDAQPQGMLQVFLNHNVFGMPIQQAVEAPRVLTSSHPDSFEPHTSKPGRLSLEAGIASDAGSELSQRGHDVEWLEERSNAVAGVCAISADLERGVISGGADPRRSARAMGW